MANIPALAGYQLASGAAAASKFGGGDTLTDPNGNVLALASGAGLNLLDAACYGALWLAGTGSGPVAWIIVTVPSNVQFIHLQFDNSHYGAGAWGEYWIDVRDGATWYFLGHAFTTPGSSILWNRAFGAAWNAHTAGQWYEWNVAGATPGLQASVVTPATRAYTISAVADNASNDYFYVNIEYWG